MCFTFDELYNQNQRNNQQSVKNCALLNRAEPYFNMFPVKMIRNGTFKLMSSRNNNFSNRGQKLTIHVNKEQINETSLLASNDIQSDNKVHIVGIVMGTLIGVGLICIIIYKRKDISEHISQTRKNLMPKNLNSKYF